MSKHDRYRIMVGSITSHADNTKHCNIKDCFAEIKSKFFAEYIRK